MFDLTCGTQASIDDIENKLEARSIAARVEELSSLRSWVHNSISKRCALYRFRVRRSAFLFGLSEAPRTTDRKTALTRFRMTSVCALSIPSSLRGSSIAAINEPN